MYARLQYMRWNWHYEAIRRRDRWAMSVAWHLPRRWAMWAFVRVAVEGCEGNPMNQSLKEIMNRWERGADDG